MQDLAHPLDVPGLAPEVELGLQRLGEVLHDGGRVDDLAQPRTVGRLSGEHAEQPEVARDRLPRAGPLHLDDDALAVRQGGAVHLRDRAGGERLELHALEHVVPRDAELLLHHLDHLGLGEGRHLVAQRGELLDVRRGHEVGTRREHLPELAERRAELLERLAQPLRALAVGVGPGLALAAREQLADAVLGDDAGDLRRTPGEQEVFLLDGLGDLDELCVLAVERRRVDGDDGAVRDVGDAVRDVAEQELLVAGHPRVADDDDVGVLLGGDPHDRIGRLVVDDEPCPTARPGDLVGEVRQLGAGRVEDVVVDAVLVVVPHLTVGVRQDDLDQEELGREAARQVGRPLDGPLGRLRPVGRHHDPLHTATLQAMMLKMRANVAQPGIPAEQ